MTYFLIIASMAVLSMAAGASLPFAHLLNRRGELNEDGTDKGGLMPFNMKWLPELIFAVVIGFCAVQGYETLGLDLSFKWTFIVWAGCTAWSYIWMQTGHAAILPWDKVDKRATRSRDNTLTPVVHFLCRITGVTFISGGKYTEAYVWAFAGVKGFLIGLPVGGLPLAVLWPLGYEIGSHAKNHLTGKVSWDLHMVSEGASGAGAGIACVLWIEFAHAVAELVRAFV